MKSLIYYLIYKFVPYVWLHSQEKYYPTDIQLYINQSSLWCNETEVAPTELATSANVAQLSQQYGIDANEIRDRCYLRPIPEARQGLINQVNQAPVYAFYRDYHSFFEIKYLFFYGFNGAYNILHFFNYLDVKYGEHDTDIEHLTLRFQKHPGQLANQSQSKLTDIYYAAHTNLEGMWHKPDQIEWEGSHPISYSALDGHGSYPHMGVYPRIFGFASDYCDRGTLWKPSRVVIINDQLEAWHQYQGRYAVNNEIQTILGKTVGDSSAETNVSTNPFNRFFYLYPE